MRVKPRICGAATAITLPKNSRHGRFQVRKFLNIFTGETAFCYAPFEADKAELMRIEKRLNDALMPPYSRRDFSAEVKAAKGAWQ
jgi:hypothetical protein